MACSLLLIADMAMDDGRWNASSACGLVLESMMPSATMLHQVLVPVCMFQLQIQGTKALSKVIKILHSVGRHGSRGVPMLSARVTLPYDLCDVSSAESNRPGRLTVKNERLRSHIRLKLCVVTVLTTYDLEALHIYLTSSMLSDAR